MYMYLGIKRSLCLVSSSGLGLDNQRLVTNPQTKSCCQAELNGLCVMFKVNKDVFHHFIVSFGAVIAA